MNPRDLKPETIAITLSNAAKELDASGDATIAAGFPVAILLKAAAWEISALNQTIYAVDAALNKDFRPKPKTGPSLAKLDD